MRRSCAKLKVSTSTYNEIRNCRKQLDVLASSSTKVARS